MNDPLNILFPVRPDSRGTARALLEMGLRGVIDEDGLHLVSYVAPKPKAGTDRRIESRCQPRDELGRFVAYWVLSHEIETDLCEAGDHYTEEEDAWIAAWPDIG